MIKVLQDLIGAGIMSLIAFYIFSKLCKKEIDWKSRKTYEFLLIYMIVIIVSYIGTSKFFKNMINFICFVVLTKYMFKKNINKTVLLSLLTLGIVAISEMIYVFILVGIVKVNAEILQTDYFVSWLTNMMIAAIGWVIVRNSRMIDFLNKKVENIDSQNRMIVIMFAILSLLSLTIVIYYIYFKVNFVQSVILAIALILILLFLVFNVINEKEEYAKLQIKYNLINQNLDTYERVLRSQKKQNHENSNNLAVLRGMIQNGKESAIEALEYIDSLTGKRLNDDQELLMEIQDVPTGGLQGLLYQKLLLMKEKKINYNLQVSKLIIDMPFHKIKSNKKKNLYTIVGVYLDNAIQAVEKYQEKLISIYLYMENHSMIITISNNYEGYLDITNFDEEGYTDKGDGHGYGLCLVKNIIDKNKDFCNERIINGSIFSQKLIMKI